MAPMRCRSPTNFMRWQQRSVQFEAPQFLSWKIPSSDQQRDTTSNGQVLGLALVDVLMSSSSDLIGAPFANVINALCSRCHAVAGENPQPPGLGVGSTEMSPSKSWGSALGTFQHQKRTSGVGSILS